MTEAEWLAATDPAPMLSFLRDGIVSLVDEGASETRDERRHHLLATTKRRKHQLFSVACCRLIWQLLPEESKDTLTTVELHADGLAGSNERLEALEDAWHDVRIHSVASDRTGRRIARAVARVVYLAVHSEARETASEVKAVMLWASLGQNASKVDELQAGFLRDIFGNPFRPVTLNPAWLTSTVLALAQQMYESRDFSPMPILADALQDAGCDNADILNHCRQPGEHVRGCWVVDLILSK